ncbi:MAG: serine/threonine protein kinase [Planctomycetota bacterium]|nr:MAG: serine/threonine protein kinase [Planctomycetota bacterium]
MSRGPDWSRAVWQFGEDADLRSSAASVPGPAGVEQLPFAEIRELGQGAMGKVYAARDASGREVAVKVVARTLSQRARSRLRREGELAAALQHPGIVRVFGGGEVGGLPYLVFELVRGARSFADALPELGRAERIRIILECAEALAHAHARGVLHRDIKPGNILLDNEGRAKVADFGLAWAPGVERLTATQALVGTPTYMSPEQLAGVAAETLTPAVDVWALGVVLYVALCDRLPFDAEGLLELARQVSIVPPPRPRRLDRSIPPALERVCLRALAKDPAHRFPDAAAFAAALREASAAPPQRWRRAALAGAAGGALLLLALLLATASALRDAPSAAQRPDGPEPTSEPRAGATPAGSPRRDPVRALVEAGAFEEAAAVLSERPPAPEDVALRAEVAAARGEDPMPALRAACARWPEHPAPRLALARLLWVDCYAPGLALEALGRPQHSLLRSLATLLESELAEKPLALAAGESPEELKEVVAAARCAHGRLGRALARRLEDPRFRFGPGAPSPDEARAYAREAYALALKLATPGGRTWRRAQLGLAELAPPSSPERTARLKALGPPRPREAPTVALLRAEAALARGDARRAWDLLEGSRDEGPRALAVAGRAALALGRSSAAARLLRQALGPEEHDPVLCRLLARSLRGRDEAEAGRLEARAERLRSADEEAAHRLLDDPRRKVLSGDDPELQASFEHALALDPLSPEAHFLLARRRLSQSPALALEALRFARRDIRLLGDLAGSFLFLGRLAIRLGGRDVLCELAADERLPPGPRLAVVAAAVEYRDRDDLVPLGVELANRCLREDPADAAALVQRGFLLVRAGSLAQAERDLALARRLDPTAPSPVFYQALLGARREAPPGRVRAALEKAKALGYGGLGESTWSLDDYPELRDYSRKAALSAPARAR